MGKRKYTKMKALLGKKVHDFLAYKSYKSMLSRCLDESDPGFPHYGGRGIKVCQRWQESFVNFLTDMGERPTGYTLERDDVDGNYEPSNCRWVTKKEQQKNRTTTRFATIGDRTLCLSDWAFEYKINYSTLLCRLDRGWPIEEALTTPVTPHPWNSHGERSTSSKLTERQVREIKQKWADGVKARPLAEQYKVSDSTIRSIVTGRNWKKIREVPNSHKD